MTLTNVTLNMVFAPRIASIQTDRMLVPVCEVTNLAQMQKLATELTLKSLILVVATTVAVTIYAPVYLIPVEKSAPVS